MYLDRTEEQIAYHPLEYWIFHFFSHDNEEQADLLIVSTRQCSSWEEALLVARDICIVDPELCVEGDIPWRINNFFSSGDMCAADVMLDTAWESYHKGHGWQKIIQDVTIAEEGWRQSLRGKKCISIR